MTPNQVTALRLLREDAERDLYMGQDGFCYVTHMCGRGPTLTIAEADDLESRGEVRRKWPDVPGYWRLQTNGNN